MIINPQFPIPTLIQSVRAKLALMEQNFTVCIKPPEKKIYDYLKPLFPGVVRYSLYQNGKIIPGDINHKTPSVSVLGRSWPLLFPKCMFNTQRFWNPSRAGIFFQGFTPDFRKEAFKRWEKTATIKSVVTGRKDIKRFWDEDYFAAMGKYQFILCPDGGWPWSYRFFEAIMSGAVPIVQTRCPVYTGYFCHDWTTDPQDLVYDEGKVKENFDRCFQQLTF